MKAAMQAPVTAYVGLGSNLGDRLAALRAGIDRLHALRHTRVTACSPVYETAPWGPVKDQPFFLNAVCEVVTTLDAHTLLECLLRIEAELGRVRTIPKGPRTLDLDLLLYGPLVLEEADLTLPHPGLRERAFVLQPLVDIAPLARHPVDGGLLRDDLQHLGGPPLVLYAGSDVLVPRSSPRVSVGGRPCA